MHIFGQPIQDMHYCHLPMILDTDGSKLSKRNAHTKSILEYRDQGILPNAIIQYVLSLGNKSIPRDRALTLAEMINMYEISETSRKDTKFCERTLTHLNKLHTRKLKPTCMVDQLLLTRAKTTLEFKELQTLKSRILQAPMEVEKLVAARYTKEACSQFRASVLAGASSPPLDQLIPKIIATKGSLNV